MFSRWASQGTGSDHTRQHTVTAPKAHPIHWEWTSSLCHQISSLDLYSGHYSRPVEGPMPGMEERIRNKSFARVTLHGKNKMPQGFTFLEAGVDVNRSSSWSVFMVFKLEFSALMTALATDTLNLWRLITFSSRVPRMMRRWTFTTFLWPKRCALSIAYKRAKDPLNTDWWYRTENTSIIVQLLAFV